MIMTFPFRTLTLLGAATAVLAACTEPRPDPGGSLADVGKAACMAAARSAAFHSQGGRSGAPASRTVARACGATGDATIMTAATAPAASDQTP